MSNSNETNNADSNKINTKQVIKVIGFIILGVVGFYFANFHNGLSEKNEDWGTFGDYFGGILNPVIAAFAFYLISKTYDLQKTELEETRKLLKVSTDAQKNQIKLAALTALLNSNLTRIGLLESEKISLLQGILPDHEIHATQAMRNQRIPGAQAESLEEIIKARRNVIKDEINRLTEKNNELEEQIEAF